MPTNGHIILKRTFLKLKCIQHFYLELCLIELFFRLFRPSPRRVRVLLCTQGFQTKLGHGAHSSRKKLEACSNWTSHSQGPVLWRFGGFCVVHLEFSAGPVSPLPCCGGAPHRGTTDLVRGLVSAIVRLSVSQALVFFRVR